MTNRLGIFLYRLGSLLCVIAVLAAVSWNGWTFYQRQQVREKFDAQFRGESSSLIVGETIARQTVNSELPALLVQELAKIRASTQNLKRSMTYGGFLIIAGLFAYGLGWAARQAGRAPSTNRRE